MKLIKKTARQIFDRLRTLGSDNLGAPGCSDAFDEKYYLSINPDVAEAVKAGRFRSGREHFVRLGRSEGRNGFQEQGMERGPGVRSSGPPTCILHGGGHKTGTSALQKFLINNRAELAQRGYYVPRTGGAPAHHPLIRRVAGMPVRTWHEEIVEAFLEEVARSNCDNILLSSELIETLMNRNASQIFDFLSGAGFRVKFIFYVRNTPQLLNSQYSQLVKTYRIDVPFKEFIKDRLAKLPVKSATSLLDVLDEKKVERLIRPYDERIRKVGVVADFLECVGLKDFGADKTIERTNESVGPVALEAGRRSIREITGGAVNLGQLHATKCGKMLRASLAEVGFREPSYNGLSNDIAQRIQRAHQRVNDQFAQRAWGKTWADVFAADIGGNHVSNDLLDRQPTLSELEALYEILEKLLPRIKSLAVDERFHKKEGFNRRGAEQIATALKTPRKKAKPPV